MSRNKIKFRHSFVSAQVFGLPSSTSPLGFPKKVCDISNPLNFSKLESFVNNLNPKPDIIAVTETWIQNNSLGPYCNRENYNYISNSRKIAKGGGGVGLYIKNCYKFNLIDELTIINKKIFESIFIKIQLDNENLFCGNIYRSSNDNHLNQCSSNFFHRDPLCTAKFFRDP